MLTNFDKTATEGRRNLTNALTDQALLRGIDSSVVAELVERVVVEEAQDGQVLVGQGDSTTDVFLIISGTADITIDKRSIGLRKPGQHIGEMAALDPAARRCATVLARGPTVTARIAAGLLFELADKHPRLWCNLSRVLADRLRERPVRARNETPVVFLGGSAEGLPVTDELVVLFDHKPFVTVPWTTACRPSDVTMDALLRVASTADFAVLSFGEDDVTESRDEARPSPRDNVVLEYGLFVGALGSRERVFVLMPRRSKLKLPSDMWGLTVVDYDVNKPLGTALAAAAKKIAESVLRIGPR